MVTVSQKLTWLCETLHTICSVPQTSAEELDYQVYENLDCDVRAALWVENLRELAAESQIPADVVPALESLRDKTIALIDLRMPGSEIRTDPHWREVSELARKFLLLIEARAPT